jgi:hypothetical protein
MITPQSSEQLATKEALDASNVDKIIAIYEKGNGKPGHLRAGEDTQLYEGRPLASTSTEGEVTEPNTEVLDNVIIVGGTVLGLTRTRSEDGSRTSHVRLAVLPVGSEAGTLSVNHSSATVLEVDLDELRERRVDGAKKDWEAFSFGRKELSELTGKIDSTVSSIHFGLTVIADGRILITDNSTNGTTVISSGDLMRNQDGGGFSDVDKGAVIQFIEPLEKKPYLWQREYAGQRIVDPE